MGKKKKQDRALTSIPKTSPDVYFKQCMTDIRLARDFLHFNLPERIKSRIDLTTLSLAPQEYVTSALRRKIADVVYTVSLRDTSDGLGYLAMVAEHQIKPKRSMPLRMLELMVTMMRQISDNQPDKKRAALPVVIPLIVSNYHHAYPYSVRFLDLFEGSGQAIVSSLLNGDLPLVDLASMPDDGLKTHLRAAIMELALKKVKNSEMCDVFTGCVDVLQCLSEGGLIDEHEASDYAQNLVYFLYDNLREVPSAEEVDNLFATAEARLPTGAGEVIMTLREHFEQRVQQGMQQGMQQGKYYVARNMLKKDFTDQQICDCAEISMSELHALRCEQLEEIDAQH